MSAASFGLWVRQRRRQLDQTQEQLADAVGCSVSAIRKIEGDERRPSQQVAELLAEALQIAPSDRPLFLRVARMELGYDHLAAIAPPADARPFDAAAVAALLAPRAIASLAPAVYAAPPTLPAAAPVTAARPLRPSPTAPLTPLIGRDVELVQTVSTLMQPECRLLTLLGPGGIGKTRLALAAAERLQPEFVDGVAFVPLAGVLDANQLPAAISAALAVGQFGHGNPQQQLLTFVRDKQLLLVLDSMEHLLDADTLLTLLLATAPDLKLLATSREQLGLQTEWLFSVRGLSSPSGPVTGWEHSSAMRLFVQSARRAVVGFTPSDDDLQAIATICRLVEGMPLAIELAASWLRVLSPAEVAAELGRDWEFLSGSARDLPERHRSLRAVFDHSWALLNDRERRVLRDLAVFRQGFRREAAQAVAGATLADLSALEAKSLLYAGSDRFALQELVRQFAAARLDASGEGPAVRARHAGWMAQWAEQMEPSLHGDQQLRALHLLDADKDNVRAALAWFAGRADAEGLRLCNALWWFWFMRGRWKEGRDWLATFLALSVGRDTPLRARALACAANLAWLQGDSDAAERSSLEALTVAERCGADAAAELPLIDYVRGQVLTYSDAAASAAAFARSLATARSLDQRWHAGRALYRLGITAFVDNDLPAARSRFEEALAVFRALGDLWGIYAVQSDLGGISRREGQWEAALQAGREAQAMCQSLGFRQGHALELLSVGHVLWGTGQFDDANAQLAQARRTFAEIDNRRGVADAHFQLGNAALYAGRVDEAAVQYGHALRMSREQGFAPSIASALLGQAEAALAHVDDAAAQAALVEALALEQGGVGLRFLLPGLLEAASELLRRSGNAAAAVGALAAADGLRARLRVARLPVEEACVAARSAALHASAGPAYVQGWDAGAALPVDEAVAATVAALRG